MRFLQPTLALLALPATIVAVSLSDFTPRVSDLPSSCQTVYTQSISGCSASDFASDACSRSCIEALDSFTSKVKSACGNKGIEGNNIITTFLSGGGPSGLCSNADAVLGGGSASSESSAPTTTNEANTTKPSSSSEASSTSTTPSSTETTSSAPASSSSAVLSGTATATSLSSSTSTTDGGSSSGILVDTSSVPSATSTSTPSSGDSQTNMNDNSGGGSPFDSEGNMNSMASASTPCTLTAVLLTIAMVVSAMLRQREAM